MNSIDFLLAVSGFLLLLLFFSSLSTQENLLRGNMEDYSRAVEGIRRVMFHIISEGDPPWWSADPSNAEYFGLMDGSLSYVLDRNKTATLQALCVSNEDLVEEKLGAPEGYHVFIRVVKVFENEEIDICNPPVPGINKVVSKRETFAELEGDMARITVEVWK